MLVVLRIFMMGQTTPGTLFLRVIIMRWTLGSYITINTTVGAYCISLKKWHQWYLNLKLVELNRTNKKLHRNTKRDPRSC
jgi:hypothetical protein